MGCTDPPNIGSGGGGGGVGKGSSLTGECAVVQRFVGFTHIAAERSLHRRRDEG